MGLGGLLDTLKIWAESIISTMGYPGLYFIMFLENIFPPIPSEVVLPLAGSLSVSGRFDLLWITVVGMFGSLTGACVFYGLGKLLGEKRVRMLIVKFGKYAMLTTDDLDKSLTWFNRYGDLVIFFGRMVPIVRSLISIPAGIASMNLMKFIPLTIIGTALWSFLLALGGRLLGSQWRLIVDWINSYQILVEILALAAVLIFVGWRFIKSFKNQKPQSTK